MEFKQSNKAENLLGQPGVRVGAPELQDIFKNTDAPIPFGGQTEMSGPISYPIVYKTTAIHHPRPEKLEEMRVLNDASSPDIVNAYKTLRTQVLKKMAQNGWTSLAVIGARQNQGVTLTAVNLAISVARDERYTCLLADFNLKRPSVHHYFDYRPEQTRGVTDLLNGDEDLTGMFVNPGVEGLVFLPGGRAVTHSSELLMTQRSKNMVRDIKNQYISRIIIFDLPPVLESDDALAFLDEFDACLLVIEDGVTKKSDVQEMSELLGDKPVLGVVYNNMMS